MTTNLMCVCDVDVAALGDHSHVALVGDIDQGERILVEAEANFTVGVSLYYDNDMIIIQIIQLF